MQTAEHYLHRLATQGLGQESKLLKGLAVHYLGVAETEDQNGGAVSAVFINSFDNLVDVLVKV